MSISTVRMLSAFMKGMPIFANFSQQHSLTDPCLLSKVTNGEL